MTLTHEFCERVHNHVTARVRFLSRVYAIGSLSFPTSILLLIMTSRGRGAHGTTSVSRKEHRQQLDPLLHSVNSSCSNAACFNICKSCPSPLSFLCRHSTVLGMSGYKQGDFLTGKTCSERMES